MLTPEDQQLLDDLNREINNAEEAAKELQGDEHE